ncbi:MAG TPA: TolC family protein [Pirellulales bacterium]|nr:TolC family protein [Pirellulales bacterium]
MTTRFLSLSILGAALLTVASGCRSVPSKCNSSTALLPSRSTSATAAPANTSGATASGGAAAGGNTGAVDSPVNNQSSAAADSADAKPTTDITLTSGQAPIARQTALSTGGGPAAAHDLPAPAEEVDAHRTCTLSLAAALATGLAQNPDLITARGTANVGAAVVDTARVYPWNPFVQAEYFPQGHPFTPASAPGGQAGGSNYYVWLMQRFELGHQRRYREESAIAAFGQVRWNIRQVELLNVAQTERLFFTALYQRQLRDLAGDTETLSRHLVEVVERRFQAGIGTTLEMANARVAARQAHRQFQLAEATFQAALLALRQQLGLAPGMPLVLSGDLTRLDWQPIEDVFCSVSQSGPVDPTRLAAEMAEARPDVMAARSGAAIARANLRLSRAARIQDVQAGPIYQTADDGTRYIGLRLQRDFGVFNNGSALASQRETELYQQMLAHNQLQRRATVEAAAAIDRYERARRFVADGQEEGEDFSADELSQVVGQFEAGKADIVNVLGIQNNLLLDVRAELDLINEVAQAAAQVTQMTGLPPERLLAPSRPEPLPPAPDGETGGDSPER